MRRYILMLQDLGIPVEATRGPHGVYRLRPGFKLPPLMLSDHEALAVTLSLIAAQRQGLTIDPQATVGALAKIERVLPEVLRERLEAVREVITFTDLAPPPRPTSTLLLCLGVATQLSERVRLRYRSGEQDTERRVDPYGIVLHWERWYLAGWCHLRKGVRVFRLDRVLDAETLAETFTRPAGFDSLAVVLETLATAPKAWDVEVLLETTLEDAQCHAPPGIAVLEPTAEGVVLRGQFERLDRLAGYLLLFGCPFVVRRPAELRDALGEVARRAVALAERTLPASTPADPKDLDGNDA